MLLALIPSGSALAAPVALLDMPAGTTCSSDPAASTTIAGWRVRAGSAAWRCAYTLAARWPHQRVPRAVIDSGPYGRATLERAVALKPAIRGRRLDVSALMGAGARGEASLSLRFEDGRGRAIGQAIVAKVRAGAGRMVAFARRRLTAPVPDGANLLRLTLRLRGTAAAPAALAALRLSAVPGLAVAPVRPPASAVPRFDHVVLIMMENTDFGQVIGDGRNAPFINGLARRGTLLANYQAVYHPSDQNYLAIAGGDTFVTGSIYFPQIHIRSPQIGDLLERAGKSWMAYEEGMGTPCNTTTQFDKAYEPDDAPFVNFTDVLADPARCRAHLVDSRQWPRDLAHTDTTPAFAWIAADDYNDGELPGNGSPKSLRVQDAWLRRTLEPLFASPAWRTQRCLLILTWDESDRVSDNHVATILIGSRGSVRHGYISPVRYDHYSTARTIESALGLPALTTNDRYAQPINDAFVRR